MEKKITEKKRKTMVIYKHGYTYHLVEGASERRFSNVPKPCFMGNENYALFAVGKLSKYKREKYYH